MTAAEELRALALEVRWADGLCDIPPSKTIEALAARVEALAKELYGVPSAINDEYGTWPPEVAIMRHVAAELAPEKE